VVRNVLGVRATKLVDLKSDSLGSATEKRVCGLNGVNVLVKVDGKGPLGCADCLGAIFVAVDVVLCVEEALNAVNRQRNLDPILCGAVRKVTSLDTVVSQPLMDKS